MAVMDLSRPRTLLFMSVDLAGSTNFKDVTTPKNGTPGWLEAFETYFKELPLVLMGQVAQAFLEAESVPEVSVWKVIGDEIVFQAEPRTAEEALLLTEAFYRTVVTYDARLFERWPLRIRGCIWAARFPDRNIAIEIREMADMGGGDAYADYLGPDIDLGFRLSPHAHFGQVIMSMNLAEVLARMPDRHGFHFHYLGKQVLKGVYRGRPYPPFLVSQPDCLPDLWTWEVEDPPQYRAVREDPPMPAADLIELAGKVRDYLNKVAQLGLEPLDF